jgi:hypothetical protein
MCRICSVRVTHFDCFDEAVSSPATGVGSVSIGSRGGVVAMVQPIYARITRTAATARKASAMVWEERLLGESAQSIL